VIDTEVLIVGGGLAGLGAALHLARRGRTVHVLERNPGPGGTWRENTYPGCECDIHPALYSYSFTRLAGWSSGRAEQHDIFRHCGYLADEVRRIARLTYDTEVTDCRWEDTDTRWHVRTRAGALHRARFLILATGALNVPRIPKIPGSFTGPVLHTARWNHDLDLHGARVGIIGTGASAAQLVPALVDHGSRVTVFQRTPAWVLPRPRTGLPLPYRARRTIEYWRNETLVPALPSSKRRRTAPRSAGSATPAHPDTRPRPTSGPHPVVSDRLQTHRLLRYLLPRDGPPHHHPGDLPHHRTRSR
jgi:cation diffusion facilitator CzcD-associated flavoprotein CzcO